MADLSDEDRVARMRQALEGSGILPTDKAALSRISAELAKQGLEQTPNMLVCNSAHYCFIVKEL
jgi:hypothetical protein